MKKWNFILIALVAILAFLAAPFKQYWNNMVDSKLFVKTMTTAAMATYDMTNKAAGDELSSTYEGRHITLLESDLTHPSHTDGLVNKGDPVQAGSIVGIAFDSALAATQPIAIDTEGVWALSCVGANYSGNSAIAIGDQLYIGGTPGFSPASGVGIISKDATGTKFGKALSTLQAGYTGVVAVKVHAGE